MRRSTPKNPILRGNTGPYACSVPRRAPPRSYVAQFFEVVMSELPERATFPDESEGPANPHSSLGGVIAMELAFGSALRPSHSVVTVPPSLPGPPSVLGPPSVVPPSLPGPASVPPSLPGPPSVLGPPSVVPPSLPGPASVPPEP